MHSAFGHNHCRAVHAKGIILQGEFIRIAMPENYKRSSAGPSSKVTVRFSDLACSNHSDNDRWPIREVWQSDSNCLRREHRLAVTVSRVSVSNTDDYAS